MNRHITLTNGTTHTLKSVELECRYRASKYQTVAAMMNLQHQSASVHLTCTKNNIKECVGVTGKSMITS